MTDNPARPPPGTRLCALADIADPGSKGFRFRRERLLFAGFVIHLGGEVRGYVDSCPHAGWPLSAMPDRYLTKEADYLLCTGHAALFEQLDGTCVAGPCLGARLTPWPVEVRDGELFTA